MVRDYNSNINGADSEDDEDPRTPTSVSSQGSHGYDSAGSDFVDVEGFTIPDSSLPELNIQVNSVENSANKCTTKIQSRLEYKTHWDTECFEAWFFNGPFLNGHYFVWALFCLVFQWSGPRENQAFGQYNLSLYVKWSKLSKSLVLQWSRPLVNQTRWRPIFQPLGNHTPWKNRTDPYHSNSKRARFSSFHLLL